MFGLFRKKKEKPLCFHEWRLADMYESITNNGIDVDIEDRFIIGCEKCMSSRNIDRIELNKLKREGFIKA